MFLRVCDYICSLLLLVLSVAVLVPGALERALRSSIKKHARKFAIKNLAWRELACSEAQLPLLPESQPSIPSQFAFSRALEAYEALIDEMLGAAAGDAVDSPDCPLPREPA